MSIKEFSVAFVIEAQSNTRNVQHDIDTMNALLSTVKDALEAAAWLASNQCYSAADAYEDAVVTLLSGYDEGMARMRRGIDKAITDMEVAGLNWEDMSAELVQG